MAYPRYPRYLCGNCSGRVTDKEDRRVEFFNTEFLGHGCQGRYVDSDEPYNSDVCYVDGVECWAEEAYLGGIVIQAKE